MRYRVWDIDANEYADTNHRTQLVLRPSGKITEGSTTPNVIVEFSTGLRDNKRTKEYPKGQDIFDGDIIETGRKGYRYIHRVGWNQKHGEWSTYTETGQWGHLDGAEAAASEVIGNIHESPELINV